MIDIKTTHEVKIMAEGGKILSEILRRTSKFSKHGTNTLEIDHLAEKLIHGYQAKPSFKGYRGYKYSTCISINQEIVHGIPGRHNLKTGDIVSIDCGVFYKGLHTDAAITFGVGQIAEQAARLIKTTKISLMKAIELVKPGVKLGLIQSRIQKIAQEKGYSVIKDLCGHGIGHSLQEEPQIPNYGDPNNGPILKKGMTICLEPMLTIGSANIKVEDDGWTVSTIDNSLSAHFEHTIAIGEKSSIILTTID